VNQNVVTVPALCPDKRSGGTPEVWGDNNYHKTGLEMASRGKYMSSGLYLMREILSITGITITENGEHGKGTRFEIAVPKGMYRLTGTGEK
jgi:hypothetical protein